MAKLQSPAEEIRLRICGAESVLFVGSQWQRNILRRLFLAPAASTYGRVRSQPQLKQLPGLSTPVSRKPVSPIRGNVKTNISPAARCRSFFVSAFSPTV